MKLLRLAAIAIALLCGTLAAVSEEAKQLWTCGMHPQVVLDHPGNCPICQMKLVPMKKEEAKQGAVLNVSMEARQAAGIVSTPVVKGQAGREVRSVGAIAFDESSLADVTTKYRAWVEKLNVDFTGQEVHKGQTLLELYSPDLFNAQAEYLIAKNAKDAKLLESAKLKLRLLDFPDAALAEIEKSGKPLRAIPVPSPRDGVVVEKEAVQGQMFEPGVKLYRIADLGTVWAIAQIYEKDLPFISLGQRAEVEVSYFPGRLYKGAVAYIYPSIDDATRTAKIRIELHNPGYTLKPGMFVNVTLKSRQSNDALLVPSQAVLRGGSSDMVFVDLGNGRYEPRFIKLGPMNGQGMQQVLEGLKEGELVVTSGQFLLDSEANLHAAASRLAPAQEMSMPTQAEQPKTLEYACPMPEHMSITYKEPGKCPLCGMTLVPVEPSHSHDVKQLDYYTCPMHPEVHEQKPGKCPKCGMTLIPVYKEAQKPAPDHYECPMKQDNYSSREPGKCPKCGMELIPVYAK